MYIETTSLQDTLISIAQKAGNKILEIYADESSFEQVDFKSDDSPLTLADKAAHNIIQDELLKAFPDIPILSEEGKDIPYETRSQWQRFWLVDPLDGTKEFIKRNGEFTVNIALIEDGKPVAGCVHVPCLSTTYVAIKGEGAFSTRDGGFPEKIEASAFHLQDEGLRIVCSRSHMSPEVEAYITLFKNPQTVSMGSSLKFMLVAENKADIYPRLAPTMEWDTGAAQIIVEEAGGNVINQETQEPLQYNKENLRNPHFIVFGKQ